MKYIYIHEIIVQISCTAIHSLHMLIIILFAILIFNHNFILSPSIISFHKTKSCFLLYIFDTLLIKCTVHMELILHFTII